MTRTLHVGFALLVGLAPGVARAQPAIEPLAPPIEPVLGVLPVDEPPVAPHSPAEHTAAETSGAPKPGTESGRVDRGDGGDSAARIIARGVLFLPKLAFQAAFAPVRGGIWAYQRFQLGTRVKGIFFNDEGTIGLYPTLAIESGFGINVGASFVLRDVFGEREQFGLHAGTGGRFSQIFKTKFDTGNRLGDNVKLELRGRYERRPKDAFYGIGNDDPSDMDLVDPATEARFRKTRARASAVFDLQVVGDLHAIASEEITDMEFEASEEGPAIDALYMPSSLVGFSGVRTSYTELELRYDSRRAASIWDAPSTRGTGWLLSSYAGSSIAIGAGRDYWRYGGELQRFVQLGLAPRVLSVRLSGEAVSGSYEEVPFDELPRLGGKFLLRGYPLDRFRDRVAAVGSAEYTWDLARHISASTFVDAGRVYSAIGDANLQDLRVGYGFYLEARTEKRYLMRLSVASSIDGGVFLDFAFDSPFDVDTRVERR